MDLATSTDLLAAQGTYSPQDNIPDNNNNTINNINAMTHIKRMLGCQTFSVQVQ